MANTNLEIKKKEEISETGAERTREKKSFVPPVDIFEEKEQITLFADMPGVDENSLDITLENNVLDINAFVETAQKDEGLELTYAEYETGDYHRSFTISDEIDREKITATVKNGVLKLVLPKAEKMKSRKINVKIG